ncbi:MAG TPA: hypothetical protein VIT91_05455 [Chthoniobacterales bacterium]
MRTQPNSTLIEGIVTDIRADDGGIGYEVSLSTKANVSREKQRDFIRPAPGREIKLFCLEAPGEVRVGDLVRAQAELLGGPKGQRVVLQEIEKL